LTDDLGPDFVGPAEPAPHKLEELRRAEGKTISFIEFGATSQPLVYPEHKHESEALVLHFTDGTALLIQPGSNMWNVSSDLVAAGIDPSRITTDLITHWLE
jgi:hypothetical protein